MANVDTNEEFWGITLTGTNKTQTWNPVVDEEEIEHKIQLTQACLGTKAKENERNVIEVHTEDDDGKKISCAIVSLRVGFVECMHLELGFTNPVKFVLKEGNGPISLCGVHLSALPLDLDGDEDDAMDSSDEEDVPQLVKSTATIEEVEDPVVEEKVEKVAVATPAHEEKPAKKRTAPKEEKEVAAKKKKEEPLIVEEDKEDEDEDEDEDDDDEDDEDDDDEDDEDDDMDDISMEDLLNLEAESDEDDDDDEDEEEDDEDEDEEEEEETPKPKQKLAPKVNGVAPKKDGKGTPAPKAKPSANKENATPKGKPTKENTKKDTTTPKKNPEELRTFLLKSPNLPKKYEKFSNFLKNNMKVTDSKTQKELWEFVQKNKK